MALALLYGAGSGAVHAVTGPDHLLSLGPIAIQEKRAPWRIGLSWGTGHALGTLLLSLPLLLLAGRFDLARLAAHSDRIAGLALLGLAAWSFRALRHAGQGGHASGDRSPLLVGLVHGLTGAASLLLLLPIVVAGSPVHALAFLFAFAVGSTLAMGLLTLLVARVGARVRPSSVGRAQRVLLLLAAAFGGVLVLG